MKFCPRCGSKRVVSVLCASCLRETTPLITGTTTTKLTLCPETKKLKWKGKWTTYPTLRQGIAAYLKDTLTFALHAQPDTLTVTLYKEHNKHLDVDIIIEGNLENKHYHEAYHLTIPLAKEPSTPQKHKDYFEGTLQLRNPTPHTKQFIQNLLLKSHPGVHIAKTIQRKNGYDILLSSNKATYQIAQALHKTFGATIKTSTHLWGHDRQRSKHLQRLTVLVKIPAVRPGDVITYKDRPVLIQTVGKTTYGYDLSRQKKISIPSSSLDEQETLPIYETSIVQNQPSVYVLHPTTFQPIPLANTPRSTAINTPLSIVLYKQQAYTLPSTNKAKHTPSSNYTTPLSAQKKTRNKN
ncbi:hypothetical protein D6783_00450 [Candidatus Woesearchaeota archaeon]|nr:MAG: hypothetical protein D6783_00450 [Candidatus Woesearchaeota archaeon]